MKTTWNVLGVIALIAWTLVSISMVTGLSVGLLTVICLGALGLTSLTVALWPPRVDGANTGRIPRSTPSTREDLDPNHTISRGELR